MIGLMILGFILMAAVSGLAISVLAGPRNTGLPRMRNMPPPPGKIKVD